MKYGSGGWLRSSASVCALRAVAVLLRAGRLGVRSPMISVPLCEVTTSLFWLGGERTVVKQVGQKRRAAWTMLLYSSRGGGGLWSAESLLGVFMNTTFNFRWLSVHHCLRFEDRPRQ